MAEWTTVWVIVSRRIRPREAIPQPYIWDAVKKEWVHKGMALINAIHEGVRFETKEKAEEAALILATEQPEYMGKLHVEAYKI